MYLYTGVYIADNPLTLNGKSTRGELTFINSTKITKPDCYTTDMNPSKQTKKTLDSMALNAIKQGIVISLDTS